MKKTTLYWLLLFGVLSGISYIYSTGVPYDEPMVKERLNRGYNPIQVGDLYVLLDTTNQVEQFFKIIGNPISDSIAIAVGQRIHNHNFTFKNKDWARKRIDRPIYFHSELSFLTEASMQNLKKETSDYIVYRQEYPPDQISLIARLMYSPLAVLIFILMAFFIIWIVDTGSLYLSSRFNWMSRIVLLGIFGYIIALTINGIQVRGYLVYLSETTGYTGFPSFLWLSSWINSILETIPVFILFQFLRKRYFQYLKFEDQEFRKFLTILVFGIILQVVAVKIIAWIVPKYDIPAINYYVLHGWSYMVLAKQFSITWGCIAIGNFLNNLRKRMKELRRKANQLSDSEEKALSSQSQLDALHARVNPHFLYNSLNSIASLAQTNPAKTEEMALALSDFYKHSTNRQDQNWSTLGEELELIKTYLDIEKIRFEDRLQYQLETSENAGLYPIPRFLLQPLVENAIKYGFNKKENKTAITIKVEGNSKELQIRILDSGPSFSGHMNTGYGLKSVKKKLKLLYPNTHELHFINEPIKQVHIILNPSKNHQHA